MPINVSNRIIADIDRPTGNYINSDERELYKTFNFKHAGGHYLSRYEININITMEVFLRSIKKKIAVECGLGEENGQISENVLNTIDIIEGGQFNNINGRDAEIAPALEPSNKLFKYYFENRIDITSFYVRIRNN